MPDRIDSVIDYAAIEAEIAQVEAKLTELGTTLKTFPKANIFGDASNSKDLLDANRQMSLVLKDLKVKNAELTIAIKEQNLAAKQAAELKKQQAQAAKDAADAAKLQAAAEKEAAKQAQIDGQERLRQLAAERKAQEDLVAAESKRSDAESQALAGTFTPGSSAPKKAVEQFVPTNASDSLALALIQDQRQLAATKDAQKLLSAEFAAGNISQAEYDAQLVKSIQLQQDLKISIANTTKELSLQAKSNASIPGTIEALQTRNAVLTQQASQINVVNATPDEVAQLKAANDEIDKNNELIRINRDLLAQQKINIGNYPTALGGTFKTLNQELDTVQGKLVQGNFGGKEFDQLTAKQVVLQNALALSGKTFKTTAAEASAYKEAALAIGQVYGKDSPIFKQFADGVKAGAANTAALASEVSGVASKGKGFLGFLGSAYNGLRKLAYAIPGIGIGGLILLLLDPLQSLGASIYKSLTKTEEDITGFTKDTIEQLKDYQKANSDVNVEYIKTSTGSIMKLELLRSVITDTTKTEKERVAALNDYNKIADSNNKLDVKQLDNLNLINDTISKQIYLVGQRALAAANEKLLEDKAVKLNLAEEQARAKAEELINATTIETVQGAKTNAYFKTLEKEGAIRREIAKDAAVKQAQAEFDAQKKVNAEFLLKNGFVGGPPPPPGGGNNGKIHLQELKSVLENEFEIYKLAQERKISLFSEESNDTTKSFQDRLTALENYTQAEQELLKKQEEYDIAAKQRETARDIQHLNEQKAGKSADEQKRINENIKIDQENLQKAILLIQTKYGIDSLNIEDKTAKQRKGIVKEEFDYIRDQGVKAYEEIAKAIEESGKRATANNDLEKNAQLLQLDKDFQNGKIKSLEDFNNKKQSIEDAADKKDLLSDEETIREKLKLAIDGSVEQLELMAKLSDDEVKLNELKNKKLYDQDKALKDKKKDLRNQEEDSITGIIDNIFEAQQEKDDATLKAKQKQSDAEIAAINQSTLSQQEKDRRISAIQKQSDFRASQYAERQRQRDIAKAKFDKAAAIAKAIQNTADAVTHDLESPLTKPLIPFDIAIGAAQVALILSQPIPKYKEGTKSAKKGIAQVSEEGPELMVDRYGKMFLTPQQPSLINLAGGEKIIPHRQTEEILNHYNLLSIIQKSQTPNQPQKLDSFNEKIYRELKTMNRKPPVIVHVESGLDFKQYVNRNVKM